MYVLDILTSTGELKPVSHRPKVWRTTLSGLDVVDMSAEGNTAALLKKIKRLGMEKEFDSLRKWRYRNSRGPRKETKEKLDC